jgi:putative FmdB family regulatory protein
MPIYAYRCPTCEVDFEVYRSIAQMRQRELHEPCSKLAYKVITAAPMMGTDYAGYDCPISGKRIEGRRAHIENLKRHNCRLYEAGETQEFIKRKAARDDEATNRLLDRILPQSIGDTIIPT